MEEVLDLHRQRGCKFFVGMDVGVSQMLEDRSATISFATKATPLVMADDTMVELYDHVQRIVEKVDVFMRDGSGWISHDIKGVYLYVTRFVHTFAKVYDMICNTAESSILHCWYHEKKND